VVSLKIFDWLAKEVQELAPIDSYRNDMEELAAMWPQPLALANAMDVDSVTSRVSQIFAILEKRQPTGHGIQLVRQLASIEWKPADWASWSYDAFGLLKACISESMKESDARAFAELLWRMGGNIEGKIYRTSEDLRLLHRRAAAKDRKKPHASGLLKPVLLIALFEMLFQDSYIQIDIAYTALQRALSLGLNGYSEDDLPRVHRSEAKMLLNNRVTVTFPSDSGKRIQDLASHGLRPELFETWICELTSIVASNLSSSDKFYVCLLPAIEGDPRFAEDILPLLIHETISNSSNAGDKHSLSERLAISQCFRGVLRDVHAAQATVLSVLDIVKYLRHFPNRQDKSALGYNSWLDVDFVDLARAAIGCGSFTTALMFLEIAAEIKGDECLLAEQAIEELMYEIYTRIDDPDSFYGIRGRSIQQSLVRRFQHEHLWEKAHRFLGAQFEVDNLRASSTMGLVESLQSRGFDKQASVILDQAASRGVAVDYNLGWRTETWDLPPPPDGAGNGWNMYEALRAIHTSRNLADITHVVKAAVVREVLSLRLLSTENFAEVRRITRNIMCLRDINFWVEASISGEHLPLDSMAEVPLPKRLLEYVVAIFCVHRLRPRSLALTLKTH
jgi:serine-protein kinase ATM